MEKLSIAEGYESLTVPAIRREAAVSRKVFDAHFDDVEDCYLAAVEAKAKDAAERALREAGRAPSWQAGAVRMAASLCVDLARDLGMRRLVFTDVFAPGRAGLDMREALVTRWSENLCRIAPAGRGYSAVKAEASVAAAWNMARVEAAGGSPERMAGLAPTMAFIVLAPAIGADAAERAITAELRPGAASREVRRHLPQPS